MFPVVSRSNLVSVESRLSRALVSVAIMAATSVWAGAQSDKPATSGTPNSGATVSTSQVQGDQADPLKRPLNEKQKKQQRKKPERRTQQDVQEVAE